jgi:hypothetical protein
VSPEDAARYFTRSDGSYLFARWGRPIVPVVFGVMDETVSVLKGAIEALCVLTGHKMAETDPEIGANLMVFFVESWDELTDTPNLDRLIPDLVPLVARLKAAEANQYRAFRFDESGGIKACFSFICMDDALRDAAAETLALNQMTQAMVLWSDQAFLGVSPIGILDDAPVLRPEVAGILRAAYDPVMPLMAQDPSHALRLSARIVAERPQ